MHRPLQLYKALIRASEQIPSYNFRMYALRRIKSSFRENLLITETKQITEQTEFAEKNLRMIQRQVMVEKLYAPEKLVIEKA